ncbi:MAG: hypothetical protein LC723_06965 [Actinobacteria bacterium]|nr:hypothetical protein [Actinomycetota bacterium]
MPWEDPVVDWALDEEGRIARGEGQNIHISVDYVGARISGRLDMLTIETDENGNTTAEFLFLDDFENLKWYTVWSNPFLPAIFQAPRVFILPGPAIWVLKTTLWLQTLRENVPILSWNLADDPMDFGGMINLDQTTWEMVIKPTTLMDDLAAGSIWAVYVSRWKNFYDGSKVIMDDAEYSWKLRRWFTGDPEPWPGFTPRHGALVVDIEDHSGVYVGTSHGGTLFDGLFRTIGDFTEDFLDSTFTTLTDTEVPDEYYESGNRLQNKTRPFVVYTPDMPGVQKLTHTYRPAKGIVINCGGHSMPGVNELISAGIQASFDILGNALQIGSIGGSVDTVLKPFYEDTVAAWMSLKLYARSARQGTGRYFEYFQQGADKAYTLTSLMVLRAGVWATNTKRANSMEVADGGPFLIGDQGQGHFWNGHRVGAVIPGDPRKRIHMDRVSQLNLSRVRGQKPKFKIVIGKNDVDEDPAVAAWKKIEAIVGGLHDLGVF